MYQLCISGKGSSQKGGNCQKNKAEYSGRYANIEAQLRILIQTDLEVPRPKIQYLRDKPMIKKTLEEVQIVS